MKKKNHIKMRFSTLLLCYLAIVLCAAPCGWAVDYDDGLEHDVREDIIGCLAISNGTTVNLYASVVGNQGYVTLGPDSVLNIYSGGSVEQSVYVGPYSVLNIYSGSVGWSISLLYEYADVTVYGTGFEDKLGPVEYGQWTPDGGEETLTGQYKDTSQINLLFYSDDIPINLQPPPSGDLEEIPIDIKPDSNPNNINLKSKGVVPVAILSDSDTNFDATAVDPAKVFFAGAGVAVRGKGNKYLAGIEDVNGDGLLDLVVKVETENLDPGEFAEGGAYLRIHETSDQASPVLYEGWDEIKIVPPE